VTLSCIVLGVVVLVFHGSDPLQSVPRRSQFLAVDILMYAPQKPSFDGAIPFLWMMAVGTVACASVWSVAVVGEEVRAD